MLLIALPGPLKWLVKDIKEIRWQHFQIDPQMTHKQIYQIFIVWRYASTVYSVIALC